MVITDAIMYIAFFILGTLLGASSTYIACWHRFSWARRVLNQAQIVEALNSIAPNDRL